VIGQTISHYKITEKLGEGGMGVVYKAEDTRLKRLVALKFLSTNALGDEDQKARFLREAQAVALLDHPNIAAVHDIGEENGRTFMAIAFVDGPELAARIKERPLKLDEALDLAGQICEGLKEAHEQGVTHRDIKPANIMLTRKGRVKITDFGLAHLAGRSKLTKSGTSMGTPAYMSPEQALGEPTDRRSDIWGVGVVLYEMIAGKLPFENDYEQAIVYSIINEDPEPLTAVRTGLPTELDRVVGKALAKKPAERYQHVDDLLVDLLRLRKQLGASKSDVGAQQAARTSPGMTAPAPVEKSRIADQPQEPDVTPSLKKRLRLYQAIAGVAAVAALVLAFVHFREAPPANPTRRFAVSGVRDSNFSQTAAVAPNGEHIAFLGDGPSRKLWVQDLDQQQPRVIEDTEGARNPFWSPDSEFIGFEARSELRKVPVQGGTAIRICPLPSLNWGSTWSPDGEVIVFSSGIPGVLYEVPAGGGNARVLFSPDDMDSTPGETTDTTVFAHPHFLPPEAGARVLAFSFGTGRSTTLMVQDLDSGRREILEPGAKPAYSPSGHLVYQAGIAAYELWALPFSLNDRKATGDPFLLSENGRGPTVAGDGTLVYVDHVPKMYQLAFVDRGGAPKEQIGLPMEDVWHLTLSLDGRSVAFSAALDFNRDIWIHDLARDLRTRLTTAPEIDYSPVWSAKGDEVGFSSDRIGRDYDIFRQRVDGTGEPEVLVGTPAREAAGDWSQDGNYLIYRRNSPQTGSDLWYLLREGEDWTPHPFLQTPANENRPRFSPDGRYVAYTSNQSGRREVYVRPFPEGENVSRISRNGGRIPRWNSNGKELFYVEGNTLMAVPMSMRPNVTPGNPTRLFDGVEVGGTSPGYDVSPDGQQFIIARPVGDPPRPTIRVVQNWYEEFRDREQR
jgi:Tol biopolymer transport system component